MGSALPTTLWVIQLVCRVSFNSSAVSQPPSLHQLDCLYYYNNSNNTNNNNNRTITTQEMGSDAGGGEANEDESSDRPLYLERRPEEAHRLYYRCVFNEEKSQMTEIRIADCNSTDPPLPLYANDDQSFDLEQEFPRRVSLKVVDLITPPSPTTVTTVLVSPAAAFASSTVWLTLPKFPYLNNSNETLRQKVRLKCDRLQRTETRRILCALQTGDEDGAPPPSKRKWTYLLAIVAIACGGLGNILVCLAVCLDRSLQNVTNYFLLSLAVADLLVSLFVMPLGAIQGFFGYWPLGVAWCNVYVSCDVLACSCSIMHMCCISLGRYLGIRNPLKTRHTYSTKRLVGYKITIVWALSLMVSGWVTFLGLHESTNIMPRPYQCVINNQTFSLFGSLVAFYIPMFIMVVTYTRTVQLLRKKARFLQQKPGSEHEGPTFRHLGGGRFRNREPVSNTDSPLLGTPTPTRKSQVPAGKSLMKRSFSMPRKCWRSTHVPRSTIKSCTVNAMSSSQPSLVDTGSAAAAVRRTMNGTQWLTQIESTCTNNGNNSTNNATRSTRLRTLRLPLNVTPANLNLRFLANRNKRQNIAAVANVVRTEQKASKVLGLVFLAFVFCWAPFFLFNVYFIFCDRSRCNQIPDHLVDLALWLGYISSTINPIIYTIFNRTFRSAFNRLLRCECQRLSRPPRFRSVNENRRSNLMAQTPSSAAAGAAAVPLSLSLPGTPLVTPSSASSFLTTIRSPMIDSQHTSLDLAESSTTTT